LMKKLVDATPNINSIPVQKQQNQPLVKTLPSIGHGTGDGAGGAPYGSEPQAGHPKIITGTNSIHSTGNKHTTLPLFNSGSQLSGSGVVAGSSLPPIAGGGTGNGGDQSSRSNRSLQQQQQSAQKKKKKSASNGSTAKGATQQQQVRL